jgi:hypothetical protein
MPPRQASSSGARAAARRARDESVAPATARPRTTPTGAGGDFRLLLPETLLHLSEAQARLLDKCNKDGFAVVFAWDPAALTALAAYLSAPGAAPIITPAFALAPGAPVTASMLRRWIVAYAARIQSATHAQMAESIIAPLTAQDCLCVKSKIAHLGTDPGMMAYAASPNAVMPLATVLLVARSRRPVRAVTANVEHAAWGVPVFV